jgi:hypothetical protein
MKRPGNDRTADLSDSGELGSQHHLVDQVKEPWRLVRPRGSGDAGQDLHRSRDPTLEDILLARMYKDRLGITVSVDELVLSRTMPGHIALLRRCEV